VCIHVFSCVLSFPEFWTNPKRVSTAKHLAFLYTRKPTTCKQWSHLSRSALLHTSCLLYYCAVRKTRRVGSIRNEVLLRHETSIDPSSGHLHLTVYIPIWTVGFAGLHCSWSDCTIRHDIYYYSLLAIARDPAVRYHTGCRITLLMVTVVFRSDHQLDMSWTTLRAGQMCSRSSADICSLAGLISTIDAYLQYLMKRSTIR